MIYRASSFIINSDPYVPNERHDLISCDAFNASSLRKSICQEVNRMLRKGLRGEIRVAEDNGSGKVVSIISVS